MFQNSRDRRVLAIVIRSQRFGFAVIEGSVQLLDWGIVFYPQNNRERVAAATKRVAFLLTQSAPSVVVVERSGSVNVRNPSGLRSMFKAIQREASVNFIPLQVMKRADVRSAFCDFRARSKDEIASVLARMFPELRCKLPPKRRIWDSEHHGMPLFDAVALAVSYWHRCSERDLTPE